MRKIRLPQASDQEEVIRLLFENRHDIVRLIFTNGVGSPTTLRRPQIYYFDCGNRSFRLYAPGPFDIHWQDITEVHLR